MKYHVGIVDDQQLFSKSLTLMLETFTNFIVTVDVTSGEEMQRRLRQMPQPPDIILLDVNMPSMGGVECATWLAEKYPAIKVAALTINDTDVAMLAMIKAGCCCYLLKNTHPVELEKALTSIAEKGYYNSDNSNLNFKKLLRVHDNYAGLTELERNFLRFSCSDFTYKQIALLMNISSRTIETCRMNVFHKLNVQSRTGMVLEALRRGLVEL